MHHDEKQSIRRRRRRPPLPGRSVLKIGRGVAVLVAVGLAFGLAAIVPAAADAPADAPKHQGGKKTTFVAAVPGTDAYIGVVVGKESAAAYLCDGATLDEWLTGAESNGILALESESGSTLVASRSGSKLRGTLVLFDNQTLTFDAVKAKGKAGVFRAGDTVDGVTLAETWVRLADGTTRGAGGVVEGIVDFGQQVIDVVVETGQEIVDAVVEAGDQIADAAGIDLGIVPEEVNVSAPVGPGTPSPDPSPDDAVPPQTPAACPPGSNLFGDVCVEIPPIEVPEQPVEEAVTPTPPPLDETIAGAPADEGDALGPTEVALPTEGAFDAEACADIERGLALVADELEALDPDDLERLVFESVFSHLRDRGAFGGCVDLPELPA